jgi:hypothetical protein
MRQMLALPAITIVTPALLRILSFGAPRVPIRPRCYSPSEQGRCAGETTTVTRGVPIAIESEASMDNDLVLIDDFRSIFQRGDHVLPAQIWIAGQDLIDRVPTGEHPQDVPYHNPCTADDGFPRANSWIHFDSVHSFHYPALR